MESRDYFALLPEEREEARAETWRYFKELCMKEFGFDEERAEEWARVAVEVTFGFENWDEGGSG